MSGGCVLGEVYLLMAIGIGIKGLQVQPVCGDPPPPEGRFSKELAPGGWEDRGTGRLGNDNRVRHLAGCREVSCRPGVHSIGCKTPSSALTTQRGEVDGTS